ncbi:MAG: glycosyltransferase family 9 protein [Phycisphaerales bacterium]
MERSDPKRPPRLLVVMPSWLGDCAMATPALAHIRRSLPGWFIGGLVRPGNDQLFAGSSFFDELHVERSSGVLGPKFIAAKVRPRRYDSSLLLTNSFSTALIVRIAGIPRRIGYDRDARGLLLTDRLRAPRRSGGDWAPIPAVTYYMHAANCLLDAAHPRELSQGTPLTNECLSLATTPDEEAAASAILAKANLAPDAPFVLLNPGGNNPAKRWPPDRFAALADHLHRAHGLTSLVNGSPAEADLVESIVNGCNALTPVAGLPGLGITIGALKALAKRARLMVTNDTGPRHLAAAFGVPVVSMFGPTDHRWTTIPTRPGAPERVILADPTLPSSELANDHPQRCAIERIELERVVGAVDELLSRPVVAEAR